jgi:hypothetical protein
VDANLRDGTPWSDRQRRRFIRPELPPQLVGHDRVFRRQPTARNNSPKTTSEYPVGNGRAPGFIVIASVVKKGDASTGHDGIADGEGTFNLCSFWYVEALTRAGRVREARMIFEKMLTYANHLGLYAEQIGASGEALGNFPQAFTHLALISAAVNLDRALDR